MSDATGTFVQMILEALVAVLVPIAIGYVIVAINAGITWLRSKASDSQWAVVEQAVTYAIFAAEQSGLRVEAQNKGQLKKAEALRVAQVFLDARGIKIDVNRLSALIESQVAEQLNWSRIMKVRDGEPVPSREGE